MMIRERRIRIMRKDDKDKKKKGWWQKKKINKDNSKKRKVVNLSLILGFWTLHLYIYIYDVLMPFDK